MTSGVYKRIYSKPINNIQNIRFGKLVTIDYIKGSKWKCICDCGNTTIVSTSHLTSGHTTSCGCDRHKYHIRRKKPNISILYSNIKQRCTNPKSSSYERYGAKGITMYKEWIDNPKSFKKYVMSLKNYGKDGYISIDRINNNGNYEPDNIRWATLEMQNQNKRGVTLVKYKGQIKSLTKWSVELGLNKDKLCSLLRRGKSIDKYFNNEGVIVNETI